MDDGIGIEEVELFSRKDGGAWTSQGTVAESPFPFEGSGDGTYEFYIIARDSLGNEEVKLEVA